MPAVTPEDFLKLRRYLDTVGTRLEELRDAIREHSATIKAAEEASAKTGSTVNAVVAYEAETAKNANIEFRKQLRIQKRLMVGTWFAFGAAVIYAGISALMWCQMIKQNKIASSAVRQSVESFRTDERAWIEFEPITPILVSPGNSKFATGFKYKIYAKNIGKTAATNIQFRYAPQTFANDRAGDTTYFAAGIQDKLLFHKMAGAADIPIGAPPVPNVLAPYTTATTPFVASGQAPRYHWVEYIVGRVDYDDAFGIRHWKKFCFWTADAEGNLWDCKYGNDEDKNSELPPN